MGLFESNLSVVKCDMMFLVCVKDRARAVVARVGATV